jgi:hypothetical protein
MMTSTRIRRTFRRALVAVVVALTLVTAACGSGSADSSAPANETSPPASEPEGSTEQDAPNATAPAGEPPTATPETASGPFFLDLETGERTPLPETLVSDDACGYWPSPDGTRIAYGRCGESVFAYGSAADVTTVANIDGTEAQALAAPEGLNAYVRAWSPDGTKLLYQLRKGGTRDVGNLFVHDLSTDQRTQITDLELTEAPWYELHVDFSVDGRSVVFHLPRSAALENQTWDVWSVPVTGGEPTLVVRNAASPLYLADAEEIAFIVPGTSAFDGQSIAIAGADGSRRTLVTAVEGIWIQTISPDRSRIAYPDGGSVYVVVVATGEASKVADGGSAEWLDDDTLLVVP